MLFEKTNFWWWDLGWGGEKGEREGERERESQREKANNRNGKGDIITDAAMTLNR